MNWVFMLGIGFYFMQQGATEPVVRTIIFITLLCSNIFLTLVNRSFRYSIFKTLGYKNSLVPVIIVITLVLIAAQLYIPFVRNLFGLQPLSLQHVGFCIAVGMVSTCWLEVWKFYQRRKF